LTPLSVEVGAPGTVTDFSVGFEGAVEAGAATVRTAWWMVLVTPPPTLLRQLGQGELGGGDVVVGGAAEAS